MIKVGTMFAGMSSPSPSSLFSTYASVTATIMLARTILNDLIPKPIRAYLVALFYRLFKAKTNQLTLVVEENGGLSRNQIFDAAELYLSTKIGPHTDRLKIDKCPGKKRISIRLEKDEKLTDTYEGIELKWKFNCVEQDQNNNRERSRPGSDTRRWFEVSFNKNHKDVIMDNYVPYLLERAKQIKQKDRLLKMFTLGHNGRGGPFYGGGSNWDSINLDHPSTFETLAMEPEQKKAVKDDLDRFLGRKEFYKRVGRAWKRGYLLYGPPGTGKSSLVAAMANYLKFDVYDLQLSNIVSDSDLRKLLLDIANRSILVIEDIDCSIDLPDRLPAPDESNNNKNSKENYRPQLTLSGLLNFIDGLWSSCGDERIIIFTTNHVEKLDQALLRPGRMDMHIHMSYCTFHGFKLLASNYLGISEAELTQCHRPVLDEIESLIEGTEVTPAVVAEEFMKDEDPKTALDGLVKLLVKKKLEGKDDSIGAQEGERQETEDQKEIKGELSPPIVN